MHPRDGPVGHRRGGTYAHPGRRCADGRCLRCGRRSAGAPSAPRRWTGTGDEMHPRDGPDGHRRGGTYAHPGRRCADGLRGRRCGGARCGHARRGRPIAGARSDRRRSTGTGSVNHRSGDPDGRCARPQDGTNARRGQHWDGTDARHARRRAGSDDRCGHLRDGRQNARSAHRRDGTDGRPRAGSDARSDRARNDIHVPPRAGRTGRRFRGRPSACSQACRPWRGTAGANHRRSGPDGHSGRRRSIGTADARPRRDGSDARHARPRAGTDARSAHRQAGRGDLRRGKPRRLHSGSRSHASGEPLPRCRNGHRHQRHLQRHRRGSHLDRFRRSPSNRSRCRRRCSRVVPS